MAGEAIDTFDPAISTERIGFFKSLLRIHEVGRECILPCIVRKYDAATGKVSAEPLAKYVVSKIGGDEEISRPVYEDVPVFRICHGGFEVQMPVFVGDTGLLLALDRNCDTSLENNSAKLKGDQAENGENIGPSRPDDNSLASFDHSVFIPFSFSAPDKNLDGVIRVKSVKNGDTYAEIGENHAEIACGESSVRISEDGVSLKYGEDTVTIGKDGLKYVGKYDDEINAVTDVRLSDDGTRVLKKVVPQKRRGDFIVFVGNQTGWI